MTDFIDFRTLRRPSKPNTCLLAPANLCESAKADLEAPVYDKEPRVLYETLEVLAKSEKRWTLTKADPHELRLKIIARTPLLGFKDDVDVLVLPTEQGSTLAIYSRSRVGYSDMGANRKRVDQILAHLTAK